MSNLSKSIANKELKEEVKKEEIIEIVYPLLQSDGTFEWCYYMECQQEPDEKGKYYDHPMDGSRSNPTYDGIGEFDHECFYKDKNGYCHNKIQLKKDNDYNFYCKDHKDIGNNKNYSHCEECGIHDTDKNMFSKIDACPDIYCCYKLVCKKHLFMCAKCGKKNWGSPGDFHKVSTNMRFLCNKCHTYKHPSLQIRVWYGLSLKEHMNRYG